MCIIRGVNKAGEFLKLMKVEHGTVKTLMIPKEGNGAGWSNFYVYIKGFFNYEKQKMMSVERLRDAGVSRFKDESDAVLTKDWRKAVTIYRSNTKMSWKEISTKLEAIINRKPEVNQVAVDRAILWCSEPAEVNGLLKNSDQLSSQKTFVKMKNWKKDHWEDLQVGARYSWIGIEGLPYKCGIFMCSR